MPTHRHRRRTETRPSPRCLPITALALAIVGSPTSAQEATDFLETEIGLSDEEVRQLGDGRPVTVLVDEEDNFEVATFTAFRVTGSGEEVLRRLATLEAMLPGDGRIAIYRLASPPAAEDFGGLSLGPSDMEDLSRCRVHDCDIKLSLSAIERFRSEVDWSGSDAEASANRIARQMLMDYARAYDARGSDALAEYHDQGDAQSVAATFERLLGASRYLYDAVPALRDRLRNFPEERSGPTEDFLFWAWEDFGLRPVFSLNHASVLRAGRGEVVGALATMQLYASHYFAGALATTIVVEDSRMPGDVLVFRLARYRFDNPVGGLRRRLLERRLRRYAEQTAEGLRQIAR